MIFNELSHRGDDVKITLTPGVMVQGGNDGTCGIALASLQGVSKATANVDDTKHSALEERVKSEEFLRKDRARAQYRMDPPKARIFTFCCNIRTLCRRVFGLISSDRYYRGCKTFHDCERNFPMKLKRVRLWLVFPMRNL